MKARLTENVWMKLLALGLAIILWLVIKLSAGLTYSNLKPTTPEPTATPDPPKTLPNSARTHEQP